MVPDRTWTRRRRVNFPILAWCLPSQKHWISLEQVNSEGTSIVAKIAGLVEDIMSQDAGVHCVDNNGTCQDDEFRPGMHRED